MTNSIDVIKRGGSRKSESFQKEKLLASIRAALQSVRSPDGMINDTAERVYKYVLTWIGDKPTVTSSDIRRKAHEALSTLHPDAAYLYKNYRNII